MSIEAMKQALEALEWTVEQGGGPSCDHEAGACFCQENNAINALRAAIQQAAASTADSESVASDIYLGACITGGQLHATAMRKDSRGFVYVLATAEMNVEQLRNRDCIAKMGVTHPAPGVPDGVVRDAERYQHVKQNLPLIDEDAIDSAMAAAQAQKGQP